MAASVLLPIGLGLFGFIEPCSLGSTLVFIKAMEGKTAAVKLWQTGMFTVTRALFTGVLGALAALVGSAFIGFQKSIWAGLGALYVAIGLTFILGRANYIAQSLGPNLARIGELRGSAALGLLFGLNIPACAAPLLFALLGAAAAGSVSGGTLARGFWLLALFGLALSLPLIIAVLIPAARRALDWLAGLTRRVPFWTGIILIGLGAWSIWFGFFVTPQAPV